jgi:hypothetical protein
MTIMIFIISTYRSSNFGNGEVGKPASYMKVVTGAGCISGSLPYTAVQFRFFGLSFQNLIFKKKRNLGL